MYIHERDGSWDKERIDNEAATLEDETQHPVARYLAGETRYDLDAELAIGEKVVTAREYLDGGETVFHLKRLAPTEWYTVQSMWEKEVISDQRPIPRETYLRCCRLGLAKIDNGPTLDGIGKGRTLRDKDIEVLYSLDPELPILLGQAIYLASAPLRDAEKKL